MIRCLFGRLISLAATLLAGVVMLFVLLNLAPRQVDSAGDVSRYRRQYGLDLPLLLNLRFRTGSREIALLLQEMRDTPTDEVLRRRWRDLGDWRIRPLLALWRESPHPDERERLSRAVLDALAESDNAQLRRGQRSLRDLLQADPAVVEPLLQEWKLTYARSLAPDRAEKLRIAITETRLIHFCRRVLRGDFGLSRRDGRPILPRALQAAGLSLLLVGAAIVLALILAVPGGTLLALAPPRRARQIGRLAFLVYALPSFFLGTLLLRFLARGGQGLQWFPSGGLQGVGRTADPAWLEWVGELVAHLSLPVLTLALPLAAVFLHQFRDGVREALASSHVTAARARGLPPRTVLLRHVLVNASVPLITEAGSALPALLGGAVVVEYIFGLPGAGLLALDAVRAGDVMEVTGVQAVVAALVLGGVAVSDLLCLLIDPRGGGA